MSEDKSLPKRAAEALSNDANSSQLTAIRQELTARIDVIDRDIPPARDRVDNIHTEGDIDLVRVARDHLQDLLDEEKILRSLSSQVYQALKVAKGREAVANKAKLDKTLEKALQQAEKAQALLDESRRLVNDVANASRDAAEIGETLRFDRDIVRTLAAAVYSDKNAAKQAMIDLGAARPQRAIGL